MLNIQFLAAGGVTRRPLPGIPQFRIHGRSLRITDRVEVELHERGEWVVERERYIMLSIDSPVSVHFEKGPARSGSYGPFSSLWIVGGVVHSGHESGNEFAAFLDATQAWCPMTQPGDSWPTIVFSAPGAAAGHPREHSP